MKKRSLWLVLFAFIFSISITGCATMEELCGQKTEREEILAQRQPEPAPQPTPPPPAPKPMPKKDRN